MVKKTVNLRIACLLLSLGTAVSSGAEGKDSLEISDFLTRDFPEPSGITYIPETFSYFVVGDEGYLGHLSAAGEIINMVLLGDVDLEGISYDKEYELLVAIAEKRNLLLLIDPETMRLLRTIPVPPPEDGSYEGVAVFEAGTVALVNQTRGKKDKTGILLLKDVYDSQGRETVPTSRDFISTGIPDQSDIYYAADEEVFYILSDKKDTVFRLSREGEILARHKIPGRHQEGLTKAPEGSFVITQDSGGGFKVFLPE